MSMRSPFAQYITVTLSYWAFTLTDGALRMLVLLFFHNLGYSPLEIASLFLLYEFFGVITNLYGGWLGSRFGLTRTMQLGLGLQIFALALLLADPTVLTVIYVMIAQAISGIAKDLNKMAAKSSIKTLVSDNQQGKLYRWVALLTGSKNALKGLGYFLGGALLAAVGFQGSIAALLILLLVTLVLGIWLLDHQPGSNRRSFTKSLSTSAGVNRLSAARLFLFCSRDIWFVVALPVFLQSQLGWSPVQVGSLMAAWVIIYGGIQAMAPRVTGAQTPGGNTLFLWAALLSLLPCVIAFGLATGINPGLVLVIGLLIFGAVFAINSSVHSYLILALAQRESASLDVGFYYMANAGGRLLGTLLSGLIYQQFGLVSCLLMSSLLIAASALLARGLESQSV
ncbi:MAG: organoarsenical effux MFS transporter ArsJ [Porticoccaceae bacterium]|jgi:predicted MFS family arabinose efflux permease